jgi:hypothetical protein
VTIRRVTWTPPSGMTFERIVSSRGGTCAPTGGGFRCTTHLAAPSCATCAGGDLTVEFKGTGPGRVWVPTSPGGHWEIPAVQRGHAELIASAADAEMSPRK